MTIKEAVDLIGEKIKPQRRAAKACGYSSAHFCQLINAVKRGERIPARAEKIIISYARDIADAGNCDMGAM